MPYFGHKGKSSATCVTSATKLSNKDLKSTSPTTNKDGSGLWANEAIHLRNLQSPHVKGHRSGGDSMFSHHQELLGRVGMGSKHSGSRQEVPK